MGFTMHIGAYDYDLTTILFLAVFLASLAFAYWHNYELNGYSPAMTASYTVILILLAMFVRYALF